MLLQCNNYAFVFDDLFVRALVVCVVYTFNNFAIPRNHKTKLLSIDNENNPQKV